MPQGALHANEVWLQRGGSSILHRQPGIVIHGGLRIRFEENNNLDGDSFENLCSPACGLVCTQGEDMALDNLYPGVRFVSTSRLSLLVVQMTQEIW